MSTARDLINSSLRLIGVLASGDAATASEAKDGLASLNDLLDSWSNEQLLIPNKVREVFTLTPGKQSYTIGTGGDFNTARPMRIENAMIQLPGSNPVTELPIKIITKDEYAGLIQKTLTGSFPLYLYPDDGYPTTSLNFWMVPNQTCSVALYSWKQLGNLTDQSTALVLPPGYLRALRFSLAIDLAPEYGRAIPPEVVGLAAESKSNIKRMNAQPQYLQVDDSLRAKSSVWNWMTGEPS